MPSIRSAACVTTLAAFAFAAPSSLPGFETADAIAASPKAAAKTTVSKNAEKRKAARKAARRSKNRSARASADTTLPVVWWKAPAINATVRGVIQGTACEVAATDNSAMSRVEFFVDGRLLNKQYAKAWNCTFDSRTVANGKHQLKATAYDASGNRKSTYRDINVSNTTTTPTAPAPTPTPVPTATPAPVPTATPAPIPTATPAPIPTATPAPVPTATPAPVPTATPTPVGGTTTPSTERGLFGSRQGHSLYSPLPDNVPVASNSSSIAAVVNSEINTHGGVWTNRESNGFKVHIVGDDVPMKPLYLVDSSYNPYPLDSGTDGNYGGINAQRLAYRVRQGVPIPDGASDAGGSDAHMTVFKPSTGQYWEFWKYRLNNGRHEARWGGYIHNVYTHPGYYFNHNSPAYQQVSWGSTATSIPLASSAMLNSELQAGKIDHAIGIVLAGGKLHSSQHVWPAQRTDGESSSAVVKEGHRLFLPRSLDPNDYTASNGDANATKMMRAVMRAAQNYGLVVNDKLNATSSAMPVIRAENVGSGAYNWGPSRTAIFKPAASGSTRGFPWSQLKVVDPSWRP